MSKRKGVTKESGVPPTKIIRRRKINANMPCPKVARGGLFLVGIDQCLSLSVRPKRLMRSDPSLILLEGSRRLS